MDTVEIPARPRLAARSPSRHQLARTILAGVCCSVWLAQAAPAQAQARPASPAAPAPAAPATDDDTRNVFRIDVPRSWTYSPEQSERLTSAAQSERWLGAQSFHAQVRAWQGQGAGLVLTWIRASAPASAPEPVVRAELDIIRKTPEHASFGPGDTTLTSWNERMEDGMASARLEWKHLRNQTVTMTRALIFQVTDGTLHLVRADCLRDLAEAAQPSGPGATQTSGAAEACRHVLDSLAIVPPPAERKPLGDVTAVAASQAPPAGPSRPGSSASSTPSIREPGTGQILVMDPASQKAGRETGSSRWFYLVGGVLLVVALYFTMRGRGLAGDRERHAERDDPDDEPTSDKEPS